MQRETTHGSIDSADTVPSSSAIAANPVDLSTIADRRSPIADTPRTYHHSEQACSTTLRVFKRIGRKLSFSRSI